MGPAIMQIARAVITEKIPLRVRYCTTEKGL
jgi:hypothetical protein